MRCSDSRRCARRLGAHEQAGLASCEYENVTVAFRVTKKKEKDDFVRSVDSPQARTGLGCPRVGAPGAQSSPGARVYREEKHAHAFAGLRRHDGAPWVLGMHNGMLAREALVARRCRERAPRRAATRPNRKRGARGILFTHLASCTLWSGARGERHGSTARAGSPSGLGGGSLSGGAHPCGASEAVVAGVHLRPRERVERVDVPNRLSRSCAPRL